MPYDVSALSNYTVQNKMPLIVKAQLKLRTAAYLTLQTGVKEPTALNLFNTSLTAQARGCGWTSNGSAVLTQRTITPAKADFKVSFCPSDLESKWTVHELTAGAYNEGTVLPFEQTISEEFAKGINSIIETALWKGDTTSGNANLNKGDGLIKIIDAAAGVVEANAAAFIGTPITVASGGIKKTNISSIIDAMILAIPVEVLTQGDVSIFCGTDTFRLYVQAIKDANLFAYAPTLDDSLSLVIPGTAIKLVAVDGLNATPTTGRLFAFAKSNAVYGVDLENDKEDFNIFYSQDNDEMRFVAKMNYGVQVAFPTEVVKFTLV